MTDLPDLTPGEQLLLDWLSKEDFSQYGECQGRHLNSLVAKGLAQIHPAGEHQNFIANDFAGTQGIEFQAVSLTEAGWKLLEKE